MAKSRNPKTQAFLDQLKMETANELGIQTGADQSARNNGAVGGRMVKKLIEAAEAQLTR